MTRRHYTLTMNISLDEDLCRDHDQPEDPDGDSRLGITFNLLRTAVQHHAAAFLAPYGPELDDPELRYAGIDYVEGPITQAVGYGDFPARTGEITSPPADDSNFTIADNVWLSLDVHVCDEDRWTVSGDLRAPGSGWDDDANYDCRDALQAEFTNIEFDPETSCFFANADRREDAIELIEAIRTWYHNRAHNAA